MPATQYRADIMDLVRQYGPTPGGAPPGELVEAVVQTDSGGDMAYRDSEGGAGLGAISDKSDAWQWYLESPKAQTYGTDPAVRFDPHVNLEILIMELNRRQEEGIAAAQAGEVGALRDWGITALAHKGLADNYGIIKGQESAATNYYLDTVAYMDGVITPGTWGRIDRLQPGAILLKNGAVEFAPGEKSAIDEGIDSTIEGVKDAPGKAVGAVVGDWKGALGTFTANAGKLAMRVGLFAVGIGLLVFGLSRIFANRRGQ